MKALIKGAVNAVFLVFALPFALLAGFGRIPFFFHLWAQSFASLAGLPGDYARAAYYNLTLRRFPFSSRIQYGSFFAHSEASVGEGVYIGCYCILGQVNIGDHTLLASGVQVLSGKRQHGRTADGRIDGSENVFETVSIGSDCWLGAGVIAMANIGSGTTIGAGSVVTSEISANSVAVGSPARVIRSAS